MTDDTQRTLGEHQGRLSRLESDIAEVKADVKLLLAQANQAKGGYKTLMLVGGVAGTAGALVGKFLPFLAR